MASASIKDLQSAYDFWILTVNNGEKGGKLSTEAALMATDAGAAAKAEADGFFSSDAEEAQGFWTALDVACPDWLMYSTDRGYLSGIIRGQLALITSTAKTEAEAGYGAQVAEKVEGAIEAGQDALVQVGKDPSGLWAAVGGGLGFLAGSVLGAGVGGPFGAALGGAAAGYVGGKAKAAGIL